ncbi:hypothetical protein GCM10010984_02310 [Chishuiella changwenlii]|uniref:Uncharacterized protein n=1 Tax=Chishuiella changwenlii TaxID=1434701 RepID=A0ABQ1T9G7_9FLAO|nr:hypothetical protein GCM10010984_02310 [Chishuiella changwenlii]
MRYIVNTTRVFVGYNDGFNPIYIKWSVDERDSTLRIKDPLYLRKGYYLADNSESSLKEKDSILYADLFSDSLIVNKGSALNVKPPFYIWKEAKNDTLKFFKNGTTLKFVESANPFSRKNKK